MTVKSGTWASIVGNSETTQRDGMVNKVYIDSFKYFTDNPNGQWYQPLHFTRSNNLMAWTDDQVQPYIFKTPKQKLNEFIEVNCEFNLDQFLSIGTYFNYDTESILLDFKVSSNYNSVINGKR